MEQYNYHLLAMNKKDSLKVLIDEIERKNKEEHYATSLKNSKSKLIDYLTPELCKRLQKCIDIKSINAFQSNNNIDMELVSGNKSETDKSNENDFQYHEKTFGDITQAEPVLKKGGEQFNLRIEPAARPRKSADLQISWMANYLRKPRKDRILWESKLHKFARSYAGKSLSDKTEELMDLSAGDFADWLKSLGSDGKVNMDKNLIKKLFSIGIEDDAAKSLHVAPSIRSAIPEKIANIVRLPDLAIEENVNKILMKDKKLSKIKPKYVAFGRTLPAQLRLTKFEIEDKINKPDFPDDLRTYKILFEGITHLRSTRYLKEYLNEYPEIAKPKYLIEKQRKNSFGNVTGKLNYTPLHKIIARTE